VLGAALLAASPAVGTEPYEVEVGLWTCPRGYQIQRDGSCKSDAEITHGPVVEISSLPSAGDGAPTTFPSGGFDSLFPPVFLSIYSAAMQLGYDGWSDPNFRGWGTGLGDAEWALGSLAPVGLLGAPRRRFESISARSSQTRSLGGQLFSGTGRRTSSHRAGRSRTRR
jgi:hypothetical protein